MVFSDQSESQDESGSDPKATTHSRRRALKLGVGSGITLLTGTGLSFTEPVAAAGYNELGSDQASESYTYGGGCHEMDIDLSVAASGPKRTESSLRTFGVSWGLSMDADLGHPFLCNPSSVFVNDIELVFTPYKSGPNDSSIMTIGDDNLYGENGDGGSANGVFEYAFDTVWSLIPYLGNIPSPTALASDSSVDYHRHSVYGNDDRVDFTYPNVDGNGETQKSATGGAHFTINLANSNSVDHGEFGFQVYATADIIIEGEEVDTLLAQDTFTVEYVENL